MQLSPQEIDTLRRGERVEVDVPEVGGRCLIVRKEDLASLLSLQLDDLPMTTVGALVEAAMKDDDAGDPWLASYQSCRP